MLSSTVRGSLRHSILGLTNLPKSEHLHAVPYPLCPHFPQPVGGLGEARSLALHYSSSTSSVMGFLKYPQLGAGGDRPEEGYEPTWGFVNKRCRHIFAYIPWVLISLGLRTPYVFLCPRSHLFVHCPHYIPLPLMSGPQETHMSHCGWTSSFWRQDVLLGSLPIFCPLQPFSQSELPSLSPVNITPRFLFLSGFHLASSQCNIFGLTLAPCWQHKAIGSPALGTIPGARPQLHWEPQLQGRRRGFWWCLSSVLQQTLLLPSLFGSCTQHFDWPELNHMTTPTCKCRQKIQPFFPDGQNINIKYQKSKCSIYKKRWHNGLDVDLQ